MKYKFKSTVIMAGLGMVDYILRIMSLPVLLALLCDFLCSTKCDQRYHFLADTIKAIS